MSVATIEERLTAVEAALDELRTRLDQAQKKPDWFEHVSGSFKDDPEFDEILRLGREIREADRPRDS